MSLGQETRWAEEIRGLMGREGVRGYSSAMTEMKNMRRELARPAWGVAALRCMGPLEDCAFPSPTLLVS